MGREIVLFKTEEKKDASDIAAFLRQLADRIQEGLVMLRSGEQEIELPLPSSIGLEVKVEEEEKRGRIKKSLEVELEWIQGEENHVREGVQIV